MVWLKYLFCLLMVSAIVSCGGGSASNSGEQSEGEGSYIVQEGDTKLEVSLKDTAGNLMTGMSVEYYESSGKGVLTVKDPNGKYGTVIMIGAPEDMSISGGRSLHSVNISLKPKNTNLIGFDKDAENLGGFYLSDKAREGIEKLSGCYTPDEIVGFLQNKYDKSYDENSILSFGGEVKDDTASSLIYLSSLQQNVGYEMYASFKTRLEYLYKTLQGGLDDYSFSMSCYYPEDAYGFGTICEIAKSESCNNKQVSSNNKAPFIGGFPLGAVTANDLYKFRPAVYDADSDKLVFSIVNKPAWASFDKTTGELTGKPTEEQDGTYNNITISVSDGEAISSLTAFDIQVNRYNSAPIVQGTPHTTVTAGKSYKFYPVAYDVDGDSLTWSIENKPEWASFNTATGALSGLAASGDAGTYSNIVISVTDGSETASLNSFNITVSAFNSAPTTSGTPAANVAVGVAYSFTPSAYDADGDSLTWFINGKPDWMSFDSSTGVLTGTPASGDKGVHSGIRIVVSDGEYVSVIDDFSIEVINTAPTVSGTATAEIQAGAAYSFVPTGNDIDGDSLTWSINNKPSWASFNTSTGALTGNTSATSVGYFQNIVITASDGADSASLPAFSINVTAVPIAQTFKIIKTGQTISHYPGDDGEYQTGLTRDFVRDSVKHMVTEKSTGMMWQDTTPNSGRSFEMDWDSAVFYCFNLNYGGYADWRVPTHQELTMLIDYSANPLSIESVFNYVGSKYYWSATGVFGYSQAAWSIDFDDLKEMDEEKTYKNHIRCVR